MFNTYETICQTYPVQLVCTEFHEDIALTVAQSYLDACLKHCEEVGGVQVDFVRGSVGVGGVEADLGARIGVGGFFKGSRFRR